MLLQKRLLQLLSCLLLSSALMAQNTVTDGHPSWILQGNIYEVNVRQYTQQGTFNAFAKHLSRLKAMGVQTLWFMPINPISVKDRKGALGSYYAVSDYTAVNPEFGSLADWKLLVKKAHELGFKVIIDWVPNHTGADHKWLYSHPDFFVKDKEGNAAVAYDWSDTRQLDYKNPVMEDSMINAMKFWLTKTAIDGFRCDVAWNVPGSFWKKCITQLKQVKKDLFMLAEGDKPYLPENGFDATYTWPQFNMLKLIAKGERPAFGIDSVLADVNKAFPANSLMLYFTSNHDENSWNKADYGTTPGASHAPFAVLTQTIVRSVPLVYSGQEEPVLDSISFFYKNPISFGKYSRAPFYSTLLHLRQKNAALAANASFTKLSTNNDVAVYAFVRAAKGKKVVVILNLTDKPQNVALADNSFTNGKATNVFAKRIEVLNEHPTFQLKAWDYKVFSY